MKIHIVGIGGVATGNFAKMLKDSGFQVTGSDKALYPPMSLKLQEWGFEVKDFHESNIIDSGGNPVADVYVVGNVISRGNVEVETILDYNLPVMSLPQALYEFFLKNKKVIVVAGTHGKTTTTFLTHYILEKAGYAPGLFAGGIRADGVSGSRAGQGKYFVIEGDEYDTSFFDKKPKFLHYRPYYLILTSIEFDHADIYQDLEEYKKAFSQLLRWIPRNGKIIACYDYAPVREILQGSSNVIYYSEHNENTQNIPAIYKLHYRKNVFYFEGMEIKPKITGKQNFLNTLASLLLCKELGIERETIKRGIEEFPGVLRRQQLRKSIQYRDITVSFYEDFAHHPTAIRVTIQGFRETFDDSYLIACYEPRSATSHRNTFQKEYPAAFSGAHAVYITEIFNPGKVPEEIRLNVFGIIHEIQKQGIPAFYAKDPEHLFQQLKSNLEFHLRDARSQNKKNLILLFMSNGDFGNIYPLIEDWLEKLATEKKNTF